MRQFTESELASRDQRYSQYETKTDELLDKRLQYAQDIDSRFLAFQEQTDKHVAKWTETFIIEQNFSELFYEENAVTADDLKDDETNDTDTLLPVYEHEARMYSLEQMQQLWHLFMHRSHARKRLDKNDADTADVR